MKIPAFEVLPRRDEILDGLTFFELTGETVQLAAEQNTDPFGSAAVAMRPLRSGSIPIELLGRVLRCGKCRSYNRIESD